MAFLSSVVTSISTSAIFTSAPIQGLITTIGLANATVGAQILALTLLTIISIAVFMGISVMVYLAWKQRSGHKATQPANPHTMQAKKTVKKTKARVNKSLKKMDLKLKKLDSLFNEIESALQTEGENAKQKALADAKAGGYKIAFTLDIEQLKQGDGETQLFFDYPNATNEQKQDYAAYLEAKKTGNNTDSKPKYNWQNPEPLFFDDTERALPAPEPVAKPSANAQGAFVSNKPPLQWTLGNNEDYPFLVSHPGFAAFLEIKTRQSIRNRFSGAYTIVELLDYIPQLQLPRSFNTDPLKFSELGNKGCVWGIDNNHLFFISYLTGEQDRRIWVTLLAQSTTQNGINKTIWSLKKEKLYKASCNNQTNLQAERLAEIASEFEMAALQYAPNQAPVLGALDGTSEDEATVSAPTSRAKA